MKSSEKSVGRQAWVVCSAEVLGMASFALFPALLPSFRELWSLSPTEAGWISGAYYAGYLCAVPVLTTWTDRIAARKIVLFSTVLTAASSIGFAVAAGGAWSAALLRLLAGVGLAGTYMPGLRLISDRLEGAAQSRLVAFYTSSFSVGASLSYLLAGELAGWLGWRGAFALSSLGSIAAWLLVAFGTEAAPPRPTAGPRTGHGWGEIVRRRETISYIAGYAGHMWELFGLRAWIVAFLVFSATLSGSTMLDAGATRIAALVNLLGLPASVAGNELAVRRGRRRTIRWLMGLSALTAALLGVGAGWPGFVVLALCLLYGATTMSDSSSLTAGTVGAAPPERRGAALAVHSTIGFAAAFVGPLAVGVVLDVAGEGRLGWGLAMGVLGLGSVVGAIVVGRERRPAAAAPASAGGVSS